MFTSILPFCLLLLTLEGGSTSARKIVNYAPVEIARSEVLDYFRSVLRTKISSNDKVNEEVHSGETFPEDLYHNIGILMPHQTFTKYLTKTKNIMDQIDPRGIPVLPNYPKVPNSKCNPKTIFHYSTSQILKYWKKDENKSEVFDHLEKWHANNMITPYNQICNRFRGLTCQFKKSDESEGNSLVAQKDTPTCQCDGDEKNVRFYQSERNLNKGTSTPPYPDGCYIRPFRPCEHLSLDYAFRNDYYDAHTSLQNQRSLLIQMAFPVPRTHRCKQGTYCVDLVPGAKKPICWCNQDSADEECLAALQNPQSPIIPIGAELAAIRRKFVKLFIAGNGTQDQCNPKFNDKVERIANATQGDSMITDGVTSLMKELVSYKNKGARFCDFRRSYYCDAKTSTCVWRWICEPGKVHLGKGVCVYNYGFPCQSNKDCVKNAKCEQIEGTKEPVCICEKGYYGNKCQLEQPSFFGRLFLPVISGFRGEEYIKLQERIESDLGRWEGKMELSEGDKCDPAEDADSMKAVNFFGDLREYRKEEGEQLLKGLQTGIQGTSKLCSYNRFLHCDSKERKCVPMMDTQLQSLFLSSPGTKRKKIAEVKPGGNCGNSSLPKIFHGIIQMACTTGYACKTEDDDQDKPSCKPDCSSYFAPEEACPRTIRIRVKAFETLPSNSLRGNPSLTGKTGKVTKMQSVVKENVTDKKQKLEKNKATKVVFKVKDSNQTSTSTSKPKLQPRRNMVYHLPRQMSEMDVLQMEPQLRALDQRQSGSNKAGHGESCLYNDDGSYSSAGGFEICDGKLFLHCSNLACKCYPPLVYSVMHGKCMIPVGRMCDKVHLDIPAYMDKDLVECEFGVCLRDTVGKICRPEKDDLLILIPFVDD